MAETFVSIGQVKRDISQIVNRVAYGGERVVLTSRGKPKAAIVSLEDYERLEREGVKERMERWELWKAEREQLAAAIMERRDGQPLDLDALRDAMRGELEERDDRISGR